MILHLSAQSSRNCDWWKCSNIYCGRLSNYPTSSEVDRRATGVGQAKTYAEQSIKDIIGVAPATLDTIGELADAVTKNKDGVQAINEGLLRKPTRQKLQHYRILFKLWFISISQADYDKLVMPVPLIQKFCM